MVEVIERDVAVIGAGTAGLAAERAARQNGASTLLIDPAFDGTTCATVGCMPSKLLIAAAKQARAVAGAERFGVRVGDVSIDGQAVMRRVQAERDRFARLTRDSIENVPSEIRVVSRARFVNQNTLVLSDGRQVKARSIVIATGSAPAMPGAFADLGSDALTNETVFELEDLPATLAVVGAGAIGLELAQAFAHLGVKVSLFDRSERLANVRCPRVHQSLVDIISRDVELHMGVDVSAKATGAGCRVSWSGQSSGEETFDKVLVAVGRPPQLDGLDLENAGLELDDGGVPRHDRSTMQCGDSPVFLAGDIAADLAVLHEASRDGAIAGRNAAAFPVVINSERSPAFAITFTDPAVATIGQPEEDGAVSASADFSDQGRARVDGRNEGTVTLYAKAPDGILIGTDLVAPAGEHLAHLLAWAIKRGATASEILEMPFYHPTIEEGLKQALRTICAATPIQPPADQDTGAPPGS